MRILIVDDDPDFRAFLEEGLRSLDAETMAAESAEQAEGLLASQGDLRFDLILLDVQMPEVSGWDILYQLREAGDETPVIFVSGLKATEHKVHGLSLGADDYLVKPFDIEELDARIEAVVRRRRSMPPVHFGDVHIDMVRRRVRRGGEPIELSPREFDLLISLVLADGKLVTRTQLLHDVWDMDFDPGTNLVDVHLGRLRRKLERRGPPMIVNERGKGFRAVARSTEPASDADV